MPFQLSRGRLRILTGVTATAYVVGFVCLGACWVTHDLRWGHTGLGALLVGLALNQRLLAGQIQRRTNEVIGFYGGRPDQAAPVVPEPRTPGDAEPSSAAPAEAEGDPASDQ